MRTLLPTRRAACATALGFAVLGAVAGTLTARSAPARSGCEMDQCGQLRSICVTATTKTGCDALPDLTCKTYDCDIS
jgi:hypothetical protein